MSVAKSVVKRPVLWLVVFALISVCGGFLLSGITVDMFPEMEVPVLAVFTTYPGAGPETVEKSLTDTLESALVNTGGITAMTSTSGDQTSIIMLEFDYGANLDEKMNRVRENIDSVRSRLPDGAQSPTVMTIKSDSMPIIEIAVRGNASDGAGGRSQNELRALAISQLQDELKQIEGVASCEVQGGQDSIVRVSLSQNRLEAYGITITEIAQTLAAQNIDLGAGSIEDGLVEYSINTSGE
jgi:HAE1 family hydrophobic/amphiphilic exporter-1